MNTLNRDRNILKRLVESYGKKDVLNYVRHLNEDFDDWEDEFPYDDQQIERIQNLYGKAFKSAGCPFERFMNDDPDLDDDGYLWLYPDTLWNAGPVEDEFIQNNWIVRGKYIVAPGLLINEDGDVICIVGYENNNTGVQTSFVVDVDSPEDFANSYINMMDEINSSNISLIAAIKKYFTVLRKGW